MACAKCKHKGYIEELMLKNDQCYAVTNICPFCKDIRAYSEKIKDTYSKKTEIVNSTNEGDLKIIRLDENKI